jgi:hypothetical protein
VHGPLSVSNRLHQALRGATLFACSTVLLLALGSQAVLHARAQSASPGRAAPPAVQAATGPRRLLWLRAFEGDGARSELQLRVERALGRALGELGFVPNRSPLPFREAQLASGCVGGLRECGARVAAALESEQLAVSELEVPAASASTANFTLYRFEGGQLAANGSALLPLRPAEELELTVRALAESVFGTGAPLVPRARRMPEASSAPSHAAPEASATAAASGRGRAEVEPPRGMPALRGVGWTAFALGAAGAIGAAATAISAERQSEAYERAEVQTSQDVDVALKHYDRAEHKAEIAKVLGGVSAGVVAAGAFMLLWERFASRRDRNLQSPPGGQAERSPKTAIQAAAWPQRAGVTVSLGVQL